MKHTLGIIAGGMSGEHEVSLQSAQSVLSAVDRERFTPTIIGVDKMGVWREYEENNWLENPNNPKTISLSAHGKEMPITPQPGVLKKMGIDVVFPLIHGSFGEDGTLQGLLEFMAVPYVGPDVSGSAIAIDKDLTKRILSHAGLDVVPSITLHSKSGLTHEANEIWNAFSNTCFVKPARCGSSLGISKVTSKEELTKAISVAFEHDDKILIEKAVIGRELECAVLDGLPQTASIIGEIIPPDGFYSYEEKYIEASTKLEAPANISQDISDKIRETALKAFNILGLEGMARVDFFYSEAGIIYLNEVNTIPGFTKISMFPRLLELSGVPYTELITRLVDLAIARFERRIKLNKA
ncbi:MAG: D-alanine--D-alanine ligase family protein [bacterium]|nr:D-alanine--D-alanine ligase [bacterium]MBU1918768.1 D-alanine--D-alanine ligase [bacterium]